jgi:iron(III) transport system substrate-binding protein
MRSSLCLCLLLALTACSGPKEASGPPVVVYATESDPANLHELFAVFTAETMIPVNVSWGESRENAEALIAKQGVPADVLITPNVSDIWRAADQGALRPIRGEPIKSVHDAFKDPDSFWVALQRRVAVIAISPHSAMRYSGDYKALGNYQGKLCLSSINSSINQAVIAMLIEDIGVKPAERVVRSWMRNMQRPPFETEDKLVAALEAGDCEIGIISNTANTIEMLQVTPTPVTMDVSAMGVGRHANNPERAQQLINWLIVNKPLEDLAEWKGRNLGVVGWRQAEVLLLAERAGYR